MIEEEVGLFFLVLQLLCPECEEGMEGRMEGGSGFLLSCCTLKLSSGFLSFSPNVEASFQTPLEE